MNLFPYILGPVWVLDVTLTSDGHTIAAWRCKMGGEPQQTVYNAAALARQLMQTYGIDRAHVVRHYDVTGKKCPAPMVDNPTLWENFLNLLEDRTMTYAEAIEIVKEKAGLSDATMQFLTSYIWREDLLKKLAQAMK